MNPTSPAPGDYERLFRSGQIYIGTRIPEMLAGWTLSDLGDQWRLASHPGLNVVQAERDGHCLTLIGYLIDPDHPEQDDLEIVTCLLEVPGFKDRPFDKTDRFGGRWLLVLNGPEDTVTFADPGGLRQLFHAPNHGEGTVHCASEPGLLGEVGGLELDPDSEAFRGSPGFTANREYWWPGDSSPFTQVRRLLPNFSLSLRTGQCERYWPLRPPGARRPEQVLATLAHRLPSMMEAIARRGKVVVLITAGLDSRMVLAASRAVVDDVRFVTTQQARMPASHADIQIPQRLARRMGFDHRVVVSAGEIRDPVRAAYRDGVLFFHEKWLLDAQSMFDVHQQEPIGVVGSMAEAGRTFYQGRIPGSGPVTAGTLAGAARLGDHPFALRHFQRWLETIPEPYSLNLGDQFYLEQRAGRWLAMSQLEFGHVWKDFFTPFNSREILASMLTLPEELRSPPESILFRDLITRLWPEALSEPVNPHKLSPRMKTLTRFAHRLRRRIGRFLR